MRRGRVVIATLMAAAVATAIAAAPQVAASEGPSWSWPVAGDRVVLRPFVAPATPYGPGHRGVDLLADDAVLLAPADGVVRFSGTVAGRPVLSIDHGGGVISSYEPVQGAVEAGDAVVAGAAIGTILDGHCVVLCVHLGVRVDGAYANPLRWLGGQLQPILLPTRWPASVRISGRVGPRHRPTARVPATRTARR